MVLAVMVGFLIFRVYQVVYPDPAGPTTDDVRPPRSKVPDDVETPGIPPTIPGVPRTDDWSRLWRFNPLNYRQPRTRGGSTTDPSAGEIDLQVIRISPFGQGKYRAQIKSPGRTGWYEEGQAFESYELLAIDADAGTVTVFSEQLQRSVELQLEK
jgi:hypothetical protein